MCPCQVGRTREGCSPARCSAELAFDRRFVCLDHILAPTALMACLPRVRFMAIASPVDEVLAYGALGIRNLAVAAVKNSFDLVFWLAIYYGGGSASGEPGLSGLRRGRPSVAEGQINMTKGEILVLLRDDRESIGQTLNPDLREFFLGHGYLALCNRMPPSEFVWLNMGVCVCEDGVRRSSDKAVRYFMKSSSSTLFLPNLFIMPRNALRDLSAMPRDFVCFTILGVGGLSSSV